MSDLSQTPANVKKVGNAGIINATSGAALTAGNSCYLSSDTFWYPALSSLNSQIAGSGGLAIALNSTNGSGQPITLFKSGVINLGAALTKNKSYILSRNAGKIAPIDDLAAANYSSFFGTALDTANLMTPTTGPFLSGVVG